MITTWLRLRHQRSKSEQFRWSWSGTKLTWYTAHQHCVHTSLTTTTRMCHKTTHGSALFLKIQSIKPCIITTFELCNIMKIYCRCNIHFWRILSSPWMLIVTDSHKTECWLPPAHHLLALTCCWQVSAILKWTYLALDSVNIEIITTLITVLHWNVFDWSRHVANLVKNNWTLSQWLVTSFTCLLLLKQIVFGCVSSQPECQLANCQPLSNFVEWLQLPEKLASPS